MREYAKLGLLPRRQLASHRLGSFGAMTVL